MTDIARPDLTQADLSSTPFTWKTLNTIANTEMVPSGLRGKPAAMLAAVYMGRELGLGPMQSMQMIDVIEGRPSLSAELSTAMIRDAGHSLTCVELSGESVTVKGRRMDNGDEMAITWTAAMAKRAGLAGKRNWQQYPEAMLWARAISMLARMLFADVFAATHVYTAEELGDEVEMPSTEAIAVTVVDEEWAAVLEDASATAGAVGNGVDILDAEIVSADDPTGGPITIREAQAPSQDSLEVADPASIDREHLEAALVDALAPKPDDGTMTEIEARLRVLCRLAEDGLGIVHGRGELDYLHAALAVYGAAHVADLKRAELVRLYQSIRLAIEDAFRQSLPKADGGS